MKVLKVALVLLVPLVVFGMTDTTYADLDLEVPIGTPLDWDQELHQPTPVIKTGTPGRKVVEDRKPGGRSKRGKEGTQIMREKIKPTPPPVMNFSVPNLYNFFRITTMDIMNHLSPKAGDKTPVPFEPPVEPTEPPKINTGTSTAGKKRSEPPPRGLKMRHGIKGAYPPKVPGELAWLALAASLRAKLHPMTVNEAEAMAYMIEIGEPALMNAPDQIKGMVSDLPGNLPKFPTMKDPIDKMISRIVVLELISGYPLGMDPTYAKKTMMLGELVFNSIVASTKSPHTFLARNATAVLANMQGKKASKELIDLYKRTRDMCMQIRALAGMARKRDKAAIPILKRAIAGSPAPIRAMAIYALGVIAEGDVKIAKWLAQVASTSDQNLRWTLFGAIARIHAKDKSLARLMGALKNAYSAHKNVGFPKMETPPGQAPGFRSVIKDPPNSRERILYDMAMLAAASCGDENSIREVLAKGGIDQIHPQARLLAAEVYAYLGDQGVSVAKGLASHSEQNVAVSAVKAVGKDMKEVEWLMSVAGGGSPIVRAAALSRLFWHDPKATKEACQSIVAAGSIGTAADAFLTGMALQMLDRMNANDGAAVLRLVEAAHARNAVARRIATDEYDVTKAKIDVFPPCLELAVLSLGGTGYEPGLDKLIGLLQDSNSPVRGESALSLGSYTKPNGVIKAAEALLQALISPQEGFVRFCAYISLKNLSGKDFYTDYIFGSTTEIWKQAVLYRNWLYEYKEKYGDWEEPEEEEGEE